MACSGPPEGYSKWSLRLLADKCVELNYLDSVSHTPKHGSWLDMAEIELSALARQCIGSNRIPDLETLQKLLKPWYMDRNRKQRGIKWQFTTEDARTKFERLYPIINI